MPRVCFLLCLVGLLALCGGANARCEEAQAEGIAFFESHIRPVLVKHCYECHAATSKEVEGGLRLDSRQGILRGGESGPALIAGKSKESLLLKALRFDSLEMPPQGKLSAAILADFAKWIEMGAPDPRDDATVAAPTVDFPPVATNHWAFQPRAMVEVPSVINSAWPQNEIDHFILQKLEAAGVEPVSRATDLTLLRRLYFDLIGLPPTPEQIDAFLNDDSPQALEHVVDVLLDSPHFGERWGRHWMDVVRYADSVGGGGNTVFDNAWRYRDWIIQSLNADLPYDQFLTQQIAGDLLPASDAKQRSRQIIATGFLALGRRELPEYDKAKLLMDVVDEQVDTLGKSLLGLSLGCSRCHDHKFDPISQHDYYALAGIFESTEVNQPPKGGPLSTWVLVDLPDGSGKAVAVREAKKPVNSAIRIRGDVHRTGDPVPRGTLQAITSASADMPSNASGRLELARWIASAENPLTARVMVNRLWHWLMGRGLVESVDNFGLRGEEPSHPELLDFLAERFVTEGWSIKRAIRFIVLSHSYQLSSEYRAAAALADPENVLCWHHPRKRLEAEQIRDSLLAVSGQLDIAQFGNTMTYTGRLEGKTITARKSDPWRRRSVYLPQYREAKQVDLMQVFDAAHPALVTGQRIDTTVPTQALYLMNSPFMREQSQAVAAQLEKLKAPNVRERIEHVYRLALGRPATGVELAADESYLSRYQQVAEKIAGDDQELIASSEREAWISLCHSILASNEFLFVE